MAIDATSAQSAAMAPAASAATKAAAPGLSVQATTQVDINGMLTDGRGSTTTPEQELSFGDVLDIVNPLQHIPLINRAYRALTGDTIKPSTQIIGDMLYGGVVGGVVSVANAVLQQATGKDAAGHLMAAVGIGDDQAPTQLARADTPAAAETGRPAVASAAGSSPSAVPAEARPTPGGRPTASAVPPPGVAAAAAAASPSGMPQLPGMPQSAGAAGALSAAVAKAAPQRPTPVDPTALVASGYHPSRMPVRDAMLNTAMPPQSVTASRYTDPSRLPLRQQGQQQAQPSQRMTASAAPPPGGVGQAAATPGAASPGAASPGSANPPNDGMPAQAVTRDAIADTMMRNLAKYRSVNSLNKPTATGTTVNTAS